MIISKNNGLFDGYFASTDETNEILAWMEDTTPDLLLADNTKLRCYASRLQHEQQLTD